MYIVMHCMGMPFNGATLHEKSLGGSETAALYLAKKLAERGHKVTLFTNTDQEGNYDGVSYINAGQATEQTPLGDKFHYYAENTQHDVCIIQRHPQAFTRRFQSKINLWWLHDLGIIRNRDMISAQLWNVDGVLTVSQFHKDQICDVWGINPDIVHPIQNGVDLEMVAQASPDRPPITDARSKNLIYTSRPERGLEHLVAYGGIMERLGDNYHLYVCNYDNTTEHMRDYYQYLYQRCEELPNVTILGHLPKLELYEQMMVMDMLVYPCPGPQQPEFDEVSCITAMEAMACGLPMITSDRGALPETCADSGVQLIEPNEDGSVNIERFVEAVESFDGSGVLVDKQLEAAKRYDWSITARQVDEIIKDCFSINRSEGALLHGLIHNSDYYAAKHLIKDVTEYDPITVTTDYELNECYAFARDDTWAEHYREYYEYEKRRGVDYGPEDLSQNPRFNHVAGIVSNLPDGCVVLDYGCAHGHYTINLAKRFPEIRFIGVDITESNIEKARKWASDERLQNVEFHHDCIGDEGKLQNGSLTLNTFDCVIAAEVIEHVGDPRHLITSLMQYATNDALMIYTTPFGPWEAMGYEEHWPWRAHVWHFERADWRDMVGHFPNYNVVSIPSGVSKWGDSLGSYVITHGIDRDAAISPIDYQRKLSEQAPMQTVSLCMIVKDGEADIKRCLDSVKDIVSEVIIGIDRSTTDNTQQVINDWHSNNNLWPAITVMHIDPAVETGFDEARNAVIEQAVGDWILWMDVDELLVHPQNIYKYLRNNQYNGYAVKQHHFAVEPLGVMKTDMPVRLFRNGIGVKFFGVVHEHPEIELNEGVGHVTVLPDIEIAHYGYTTEAIRQARFKRNIELMVRDREKYPDRILGKFLWMRDLSLLCKHELEATGRITDNMRQMATDGIVLWEWLVDEGHLRMSIDGMEFYSLLAKINGTGFDFGFTYDVNKEGDVHPLRQTPIVAHFATKEHVDKLLNALINERTKDYESPYF